MRQAPCHQAGYLLVENQSTKALPLSTKRTIQAPACLRRIVMMWSPLPQIVPHWVVLQHVVQATGKHFPDPTERMARQVASCLFAKSTKILPGCRCRKGMARMYHSTVFAHETSRKRSTTVQQPCAELVGNDPCSPGSADAARISTSSKTLSFVCYCPGGG